MRLINEQEKIMLDYTKVPVGYMREGVQLYIERGIKPGGFLTALLANDLKETVGRADDMNSPRIREWVVFLYNELPRESWGSHQAVNDWIKQGDLEGLETTLEGSDDA